MIRSPGTMTGGPVVGLTRTPCCHKPRCRRIRSITALSSMSETILISCPTARCSPTPCPRTVKVRESVDVGPENRMLAIHIKRVHDVYERNWQI